MEEEANKENDVFGDFVGAGLGPGESSDRHTRLSTRSGVLTIQCCSTHVMYAGDHDLVLWLPWAGSCMPLTWLSAQTLQPVVPLPANCFGALFVSHDGAVPRLQPDAHAHGAGVCKQRAATTKTHTVGRVCSKL